MSTKSMWLVAGNGKLPIALALFFRTFPFVCVCLLSMVVVDVGTALSVSGIFVESL